MIRMIKGKCETNKRSNNKDDSRRSGQIFQTITAIKFSKKKKKIRC